MSSIEEIREIAEMEAEVEWVEEMDEMKNIAEIEAEVDWAIEEEEHRELENNQYDDGSGFFYFSDDRDWSERAIMAQSCVSSS